MRIFTLAAAAALALGGLSAAPTPASAQPGYHARHHNGDWRRDRRARRWNHARHYRWRRHRSHRVCRWVWRHHHRVRVCSWRRW